MASYSAAVDFLRATEGGGIDGIDGVAAEDMAAMQALLEEDERSPRTFAMAEDESLDYDVRALLCSIYSLQYRYFFGTWYDLAEIMIEERSGFLGGRGVVVHFFFSSMGGVTLRDACTYICSAVSCCDAVDRYLALLGLMCVSYAFVAKVEPFFFFTRRHRVQLAVRAFLPSARETQALW